MENRERSYSVLSSISDKTYNDENLNEISFIKRGSSIFDLNEFTINEEDQSNDTISFENEFKFSNNILTPEKQKEIFNEVEKARKERIINEVKRSLRELLEKHKYNIDRKKKITDILTDCDTYLKSIKENINQILEENPNVDVSDLNISEELSEEIAEIKNTYSIFYKYMEDLKPYISQDEIINIDAQNTLENKAITVLDVASKNLKNKNDRINKQEKEIKLLKSKKSFSGSDYEKMEKLQNDISIAKEVNNHLMDEVHDKNFEIELLQKRYEKQKTLTEKSEKDLESAREEINNFNKIKRISEIEVQEKNNEILLLNNRNEKQQKIIVDINQELEDLTVKLEKTLSEQKLILKENSEISEEIKEKEYEINYLKENNEKQKALKEKSDEKLELAREEIKKMNQEKRSALWKIKEMENEIASLNKMSEKKRSFMIKTKKELENAFDQLEKSSLLVKEKEKEITILNCEKENLMEEVKVKVRIAKESTEKVKYIETLASEEKKELNKVIKNLRDEITTLHEKYDQQQGLLEKTKKEWEEAVKKLEASMKEAEKTLLVIENNKEEIELLKTEKEKIIEKYKCIVHDHEEEILDLENQKVKLAEELDNKTKVVEQLFEQIKNLEECMNEEKINLCQAIKVMEDEIAHLHEENKEQADIIEDYKKKFDDKLVEVENIIRNKDEEIYSLQNENKILKEEVHHHYKVTENKTIILALEKNKEKARDNEIEKEKEMEKKMEMEIESEKERIKGIEEEEKEEEINTNEMENSKVRVTKEGNKFNEIIEKLEHEIELVNSKREKQQVMLEKYRVVFEDVIKRLEKAMIEVENSFKSKEEKIINLKSENERLKREIDEKIKIVEENMKLIKMKDAESQEEREKMLKENEEKEGKIEKQKQLIEKLKKELELSKVEVDKIQSLNRLIENNEKNKIDEVLRKEIESITEVNKRNLVLIEELKDELEDSKEKFKQDTDLERTVNEKEKKNKEMDQQVSNEKIDLLIQENHDKDAIIEELKRQLKEVKHSEELTHQTLQEKEIEIQSLKVENINYQKTMEQLKMEVTITKEQLEKIKDSERVIGEEKDRIEQEMGEKLELLSDENEDNLVLIEELKGQLEDAKKDAEDAQNSEKVINMMLKESENKNEMLDEENYRYQILIENLERQLKNAEQNLEITRNERDMDQRQFIEMKNEILNLNRQMEQMNEKYITMTNGIVSVKEEFQEYLLNIKEKFPEITEIYTHQSSDYKKIYNLLFYTLESMIRFDELNPHFENSLHHLKMLFETTSKQLSIPLDMVSLVSSTYSLSDYESQISEEEQEEQEEIVKEEEKEKITVEESNGMIQASCGCNFQRSCLKSALTVRKYNLSDTKNTPFNFRCPKCSKKSTVQL